MSIHDINSIVEQNNIAAVFVAETLDSPDYITADLLLRNTAVLADRLTPSQFGELGKPAIDAMLDAAKVAKELAPLAKADQQRLPSETDAEYEYRIEVWQPLHSFQSAVSHEELNGEQQTMSRAIKHAVWLASFAFEKVLTDPVVTDFGEIQSTVGYFSGNTHAASRRAERLKVVK